MDFSKHQRDFYIFYFYKAPLKLSTPNTPNTPKNTPNTPKNKYSLRKIISNLFK